MAILELKTDPDVFDQSWEGVKDYEIRRDDRRFEVGDILILRETVYTGEEMRNGKPLLYTGRQLTRIVNGIVTGYGLQEGWCILNIAKV